jgi:putative sporulation protein YyaC
MFNSLLNMPKPSPERKYSIHQPSTQYEIATELRGIMQQAKAAHQELIILCIGTDRSTGDALGPLTGSKLHALRLNTHVYGTLDNPVHATNLANVLTSLAKSHENPFVIAVDACLGKLENVGYVMIGQGSLKPGAAVNKDLPPVGNAYISGIVNVAGFMEHLVLQSTRLNLVVKMADIIAASIAASVREYSIR